MPTKIDLGIIFGSSGNRPTSALKAENSLAKKITDRFDIARDAALVGAIVYGDDAKIGWKIGDATDRASTVAHIDRLGRPKVGNNIQKSLELAQDVLFSSTDGARRGVPKALMVFVGKTDGKDEKIEAAAKRLKERGTNVIVITTGSDVDEKDLSGVASNPSKLLSVENGYKDIDNVSMTAASKLLPGIFFNTYEIMIARSIW